MSPISIALIGLFAFSGGTLPEMQAPAAESEVVAPTNATIALSAPKLASLEVAPFSVKLTAYNAVPEQTDADPMTTASGARSNPEVIAARSVDLKEVLPFGTVVKLTRTATDSENCRFGAVEHLIGYRVIADSMHSRKRQQLDVMLDQYETVPVHGKEVNPALALGLCSGVDVEVIGKLDLKEIPETQIELAALVAGNSFALR
jgi:3D (Asp-Asp-Asp) domain-containing protein